MTTQTFEKFSWPFRATGSGPSIYDDLSQRALHELKKLTHLYNPAGLTQSEVENIREVCGPNTITHEPTASWFVHLLVTLKHPFILLLLGLAGVSYVTKDHPGALVISVMVLVSVLLTFFQEYRSSRAVERLQALVGITVRALRDGVEKEVPLSQLVPGDIIHLSAGDIVPADIKLIASKGLFLSQAALTGEAMPAEKYCAADEKLDHVQHALDLPNFCFMGTNVISGSATALVLKTGKATYFGEIAKSIAGHRAPSSFDKGVAQFSTLMIRFMLVMVPAVFLINGFAKGDWVEAFLFAVAVAVGLTPEMLPMIVTVNLAKGAKGLAEKKVIVKRLGAIQNLGAMDLLFTDKTGTLTQDRVILEKYVDAYGEESSRVLKYAYLNSRYQSGLKSLLDTTILAHHEVGHDWDTEATFKKIDEVPYDFERRRLSVVVEESGKTDLLICKGATEEIFSVCRFFEQDREVHPWSEAFRAHGIETAKRLNADGLRVIAVAYKETSVDQIDYGIADEAGLIFLGFVAFLDPPKETARAAVQALRQYGVKVKILTGDDATVSNQICQHVGIAYLPFLLGPEIDQLDDHQLSEAIETTDIFAKLNPAQKERIVRVAHFQDHVVGFLGDGINDAPALRAADVGISVDNAVDIAKESADIILLEKNLLVLEAGVIEGRRIFSNIVKYIRMGASSNFGNVLSIVGSSSLLPFLPMRPVQILVQNLMYDLSQTAIPFDRVDAEELKRPRRWDIGKIKRFMFYFGALSSLFDYATFAFLWYVMAANGPARESLFQSGWFVECLLTQTLVVHLIRTGKIPFVQSRASVALLTTTGLVVLAGILLPFSKLGNYLGLTALPWIFFPWLVVVLASYAVATQKLKVWLTRRESFY